MNIIKIGQRWQFRNSKYHHDYIAEVECNYNSKCFGLKIVFINNAGDLSPVSLGQTIATASLSFESYLNSYNEQSWTYLKGQDAP
jgi:hypothetical protein